MRSTVTLSAFVIALAASAQPTFQFANLPTSAASFTGYLMTDPGTSQEPSSGASQTWDLSTMQFSTAGTSVIGPAAGTPYAADYPSANFTYAITPTLGSTVYNYMLGNSTALENVATNVPAATNAYTNNERILQFPLALNGSFTDSYASPDHTGTKTWVYQGYGTLITSHGTFIDQMKMKADDGDMVIWNASPLYPRLIANSDGVQFFMPSSGTGVAEAKSASALQLYPVPASEQLTVSGATTNTTWSIMDMQGRTLMSGIWNAASTQTLSIAALAPGNYVLQATGADGRLSTRFEKL